MAINDNTYEYVGWQPTVTKPGVCDCEVCPCCGKPKRPSTLRIGDFPPYQTTWTINCG